MTRPQSFPLPRLEDVWDAIGGTNAQVYSVLDMSNGFHLGAMDPASIHKTAFVTQNRQFQWNVLPFGLSNSPITFMRTVHQVLRGLLFKTCVVYVDDIVVYSNNMADHLTHLQEIFDRLKKAGLKLKPSKCHFAAKEVRYLGHLLSAQGVKPDPEKVEVVKSYPVPLSTKEVRSFLGLANYYRRFIRDFAKIAAPLYALLKKDVKFLWTEQCQQAFEKLHQRLVTHPIIGFPDMNKRFILTTNASSTGVLRDAETRYSASEREMLAVKEGIKAFCPYLLHRFTLVTDHQPLKYYNKFQPATKRLCDMALYLQGYQFDVIYKEGKSNCNADTISRLPYEHDVKASEDTSSAQVEKPAEKIVHGPTTSEDICICSLDPADMAALQQQ